MVDFVTTSDGRRLEYLTGGDEDGFPFLFHRGTPSAALVFGPMWRAAERAGLRLVTYSRPGYGASTPRASDAEPTMADDVADSMLLLDALGMDEFVTLGWSGGAPRALTCAGLRPDRCRAVVSLAGVAPDGMPGLDFTLGMGEENVRDLELCRNGREAYRPQAEADAVEMSAVTGDQIVASFGDLVNEVDAAALTGEIAEFVAASSRYAVHQGSIGYLEDNLQIVRPWGVDLSRLRVPVAVWQGAHDRMVPPGHGEWLAATIPGARMHLLPDEGHISLVSHLDSMLVELREMAGLPIG